MASSVAAFSNNAAFSNIPNPAAPYALGDIHGLTLANGMTAGYGVPSTPGGTPGDTANPPMQPGSYGGNPNWPIQRIGVLRNIPGSVPSAGGGFYSLYFYFNPNQISASFTMNSQTTPPYALYGSDSASQISGVTQGNLASSVPNYAQSQSVAWSLIFDRTYDFIRDGNGATSDLDRGVLKDVAALYNLMGTFDTFGAVPTSTPVQVVFGMTGSGQLWGFTGYISMVNITYGIFRRNMIPSRCEIDLQLTCVYVSSKVPAGDGGGTTGTVITPGTTAYSYNPATAASSVFGTPPILAGQGHTNPKNSSSPTHLSIRGRA